MHSVKYKAECYKDNTWIDESEITGYNYIISYKIMN